MSRLGGEPGAQPWRGQGSVTHFRLPGSPRRGLCFSLSTPGHGEQAKGRRSRGYCEVVLAQAHKIQGDLGGPRLPAIKA